MRKTVDLIKEKVNNTNAFVASGTSNAGNILFVFGTTQDLCAKGIDASKITQEITSQVGGSGGGRKDFAQAGGIKQENKEKVFVKLKDIISQIKL